LFLLNLFFTKFLRFLMLLLLLPGLCCNIISWLVLLIVFPFVFLSAKVLKFSYFFSPLSCRDKAVSIGLLATPIASDNLEFLVFFFKD
jgi:hypothetical protein